jgi:hypothetical protein
MTMDGNDPSTWASMVPLLVVGGCFLAGLALVSAELPPEPRYRYRGPVVSLLFVASMAHVPVIPEHLDEAPYMGVLFIGFSVASFFLAGLLAWRPVFWAYPAAGLLCVAAILAYVATRLVRFPMLADDVGAWFEPLGVVSVIAEAGVVVMVYAAMASSSSRTVG